MAGGLKGILFDKDGTLLDFEASWSSVYRALAVELAVGDLAAAEAMLVAGGLDPGSGRITAGSVMAAGNTIDITRVWFPELAGEAFGAMVVRIDAAFFANGIRFSVPVPGMAETLAAIDGMGFAMGVATSDGTAAARAALDALGVGPLLPHIYGYDSVPRPKPGPDMALAFADAIGARPAELAVVGDNRHDLEMAHAVGAVAVGVLSGTGRAADLAPLADAVLPSIRELPGWLAARGQPPASGQKSGSRT